MVQEAIHSSLKNREKCMVVKIDLANAFDRFCHSFLFQVMLRFGFDPRFIRCVKACISDPWIDPLVNGRVVTFFQASRGLRKGFPLCPFLYAIQASGLVFNLSKIGRTKN